MLGEKITTLSSLVDKVKPKILQPMHIIWNTGKVSNNDIESIKEDIIQAYNDKDIFKAHFKKLSLMEQVACRYISEVPSGMALKDIVFEISEKKNWNKKDTLNILKRLFSEYFCIPLKSVSDMILFIPKEFRIQISKLEDIDETLLNTIIADMLPEMIDIWRLKEICKNLGISVIGSKKQIAKRIGLESNFDNLMTVLYKSEIQDIIAHINDETDLNLFLEESKTELVIQIRKNGKYIIKTFNKTIVKHPISSLRNIFKQIEEKELNYKNKGQIFPARNMIGYLFYSQDYSTDLNTCYNIFETSIYQDIDNSALIEATDLLYDLGVFIVESDITASEDKTFIRLNPEFYKESSINIEDYITKGIDVEKVYQTLTISEKFLASFIAESYEPTEIETIEARFKNRFNESLFEEALTKNIKHNFVFTCNNKNNKDSLFVPRVFRKKLRDLFANDEIFTQLSSIINSEISQLYETLDKKEQTIIDYENRITSLEEELEGMKIEYSEILLNNREINETDIINEKNRLLLENSNLLKRNKEIRNELMDLKSKVIVFDNNQLEIDEFLSLSLDEKNRDRFIDILLLMLKSIGLDAKINIENEGPIIIAVASAPDIAIMVDFKLGQSLEEEMYPFGMHLQTDEYILKSELKHHSKIMKLFIANEFPENNSIIRLSKKYLVKLLSIKQLIDIYNIFNIMPIPQQELVKLFEIEDNERDIFIKDWQIEDLNKLITRKKVEILRNLLIYNELYKATDINYDSRDAEGIYNNVKKTFIEKGLEPITESEIKKTLENFSSPLLQMTIRNERYPNSEHFIPLLNPDMLIKQIKFLSKYISEISDDLIIDDI